MIRLLQSNDMNRLVDAFIDEALDVSENPFQPTTVVVQSYGMGQWLKLQLANRQGIAANVDCLLPANLVWRLYTRLLPMDLPQVSPFSTEHLTWLIMQTLPECTSEDYNQVQQFLSGSGDSQVRSYQLAERIAVLYDQYLIYRPDWINAWEQGTEADTHWQADLWRRLLAAPSLQGQQHRTRLHTRLLQRLEDSSTLPDDIPRQISIFGVSSLPAIHLDALRALGKHIDVDIYFMNPCQHYWGDIVSRRDVARRSIRQLLGKESGLVDEDYLEVGNPLLSSMGKQGREFLELMLEIDEIEPFDAFEPPTGETMLDSIKRDILDLSFGGEFGDSVAPGRLPARDDDTSIRIQVCHSKMREVEVLYDQLLDIMAKRPDIRPSDIMVMSPDIAEYAPWIDGVFPKDELFYSIADRALDQESAVLLAFMSLLSLPDMRLTATEVIDLLEVPTIARKFGLAEDDLLTLTAWIKEAGIRWELDGRSKQQRWQVPPARHNTWQFGLDRMLLGYAMDATAGPFDHILPMDLDAGDAPLLGILCDFMEQLADYREQLSASHTVAQWRAILLAMLADFFEPDSREELDLAAVRDLIVRLEEETTATGFDVPLSPRMIRYWLDEQLAVVQQGRGFVSGGVTFATLVPMRSIPYKVVCLLGMNDGAFPREDRPPTFDLMASTGYRKGDRSKRNDDRYLFLEALLSARDYFYLSYEGRSMKDNDARPPSVLVDELLDYIRQVFDRDPVTVHRLQPFSEDYFSDAAPALTSYRESWYTALINTRSPERFVAEPLPADPELAPDQLDKLARFYRHPAQYFLRNRLGVWFDDADISLGESESFTLDNLERHGLAEAALNTLLANEPLQTWRERTIDSGLVMPGTLGNMQLDKQMSRAAMIYEQALPLLDGEPQRFSRTLDLPSGIELKGSIGDIYSDTIVDVRAGVLRKRQLMAVWLQHLFANATLGERRTVMISRHAAKEEALVHELAPLQPEKAAGILAQLAEYYTAGVQSPLPFLPETSHAWARKQLDGEPQAAIEAALTEWTRDMAGGEGQDRAYRRLFDFPADFDQAFGTVAVTIYEPLLVCWSERK